MIRVFFLDFDGVFTDGKICVGQSFSRLYNVKDAEGIKKLRSCGVRIVVISSHTKHDTTREIGEHLGLEMYVGIPDKMALASSLLAEGGLTFEDASYMGDDDGDVPLLMKVAKSACPRDASDACKSVASYVCRKNGGDGCVREFAEYVISINSRCSKKVVVTIPVRKGSVRCSNKNMRPFMVDGTSMLERKIRLLKNVKEVDTILVSSNDMEMLDLAKRLGAKTHLREDYLCGNDTTGSQVFTCLAQAVGEEDVMLFTVCNMPFISPCVFGEMISFWRMHPEHDSVMLATKVNDFLWRDGIPVNFDKKVQPRSQDLVGMYRSMGCSISDTKVILEARHLVGDSPYFMEIDDVSAVDVDNNTDFFYARHLESNGFTDIDTLNRCVSVEGVKEISILDCTVRDGGFANEWNFTEEQVVAHISAAIGGGIEYVEIGFFTKEKHPSCWRSLDASTCKKMGRPGVKLVALVDCWRVHLDDVPACEETGLHMIRVCTLMEHMERAVQMCKDLKLKKGYPMVSMNVLRISHRSPDVDRIKMAMQETPEIDMLGLPDSFGALSPSTLKVFLSNFIGRDYMVGFHAHNNGGIAMANAIAAMEMGVDVIDATYGGLGRGGGNLDMLDILLYKNKYMHGRHDVETVLKIMYGDNDCEKTRNAICGSLDVHPTLGASFKELKLDELYKTLLDIPYTEREFY